MTTPTQLYQLIERFHDNLPDYKAGRYNETQVRREFIDPLFKFLGWDIDNERGYAEAYKEVVHEDAIKVGRATKAPDYSFRIGGQRKFFLEAKKPSVNIKEDTHPAYQLRRYAWSAKLPLGLAAESVPQTRTVLQRQIEATDRQIDLLVYELYGLTEEEIKIVEGRG
jgi:hypothetical protein